MNFSRRSKTALVIREASIADVDTIVEFNRLMAAETEDRELSIDILSKGVLAALKDPGKGRYLLALVDNNIVGQLMITYEWSDWRNANFWWIQSVYVHRDHRRRGVFRSMYNHVYTLATQASGVCGLRLYVERSNKIAHVVYNRLGWRDPHYEMLEICFD